MEVDVANKVKVIVHSADEVIDEILLVDGQVVTIPAQAGVTYEVKDLAEQVAPEELVIKRKGDNLELYLSPDSAVPDAIIPDYYLLEDPSPLVGLAEDGQFYSYVPQSGDASLLPWNMEDGESSYQSLGYDTAGSVVPWWPILLAGLLVGGVAAAASSSSSSGGAAKEPVDNKAPLPPGNLEVSVDGTTVTGTGESGAKVEVTDPDGKVIGSGTVDENGGFEVTITPPQTDGEDLDVTLEDDSGNVSDPGTVTAPDTTAPDAPIIDSNNGETITGTGEAGTTVTITGPNDEILGTGTVDENGNFTVDLKPPQLNGEELEATLTDAAGNESTPTQTVAPDTTAPEAPGNLEVSEDGTTVTGTGESGAKVEVTDPNGDVIGNGAVDENGDFEVTIDPPQTDGEDLDVTLEDDSGNISDPGTVTAPDTTAPDAPVIDSNNGETITGTGEAGTKVTITGPNDEILGTGTVDENGDFTVDLKPPQLNGEELEATLTDAAGNESAPTQTVAPDTTAPGAPIVTIGNGDGFITDDEIDGDKNVTVTVKLPINGQTSDAVAGDTVQGLDNEIVLTEADIAAGEVTGTVAAPGEGDELNVSVTITDVAGNTGPAGT